MQLKSVSEDSLRELGIALYRPSPIDGVPVITSSAALATVQREYGGMGTVKEEVLAWVHFTNGRWPNDRIAWVLVQPLAPIDAAGHSKAFGLTVIDARTGSVLFAGGQMATGGGP